MPTIQSSVGLVSGLPIADIVEQLMSIAEKPRDRLELRMAALQKQQLAVSELMALTIGIQLATNKLAADSVFTQTKAASSDSQLLAASVTGSPAPGTYQFTPVRMAQNHQVVSGGFATLDEAVGAGSLTLAFGGFIDQGTDLGVLNAGAGVERGKIRITDRGGGSEVVDLRFARTVDDVLDAINSRDGVRVLAVAHGDAIRLIDQTGLSLTHLSVQEVGGGRTAADLGLGHIDVAAAEATGTSLVRLHERMHINQLNDGNGLSIRDELPDLVVQFRDGSAALQIDLRRAETGSLGDLLKALNAADPDRLHAGIAADGTRLVLTDLTTDAGGTFSVSSASGGTLAEDLGLTQSATANVLAGRRLVGGLKTPLLSSLGGGSGVGPLGQISLTDRSGASSTVDLAAAETLEEVVRLLNGSGVGIRAAVNSARNGIVLQDTTGAQASHLVVANADATHTADALGLTIDAAESSVDGGALHLQVVHEQTQLQTLNAGRGVRLGSILITDSLGKSSGANLRTADAKTIGDVLDLINGLGLAVEARINDTGDGIALIDTAGGSGTLNVRDVGTGTTAADLRLLGTATVIDLQGTPTQVLDGAMNARVTLDATDTLQDAMDKINALNMGVTASILDVGSGTAPFRLVLSSQVTGAAGELLVDGRLWDTRFHQLAPARDAILQLGSSDLPGAGILATSSTNQFSNVVEGVRLTIAGASEAPVSITVQTSDERLLSNATLLVDQYNKLRDKIKQLTFFDAQSKTSGILTGSNETLQIESRLTRALTDRFFAVGSIQSLSQIGISFSEDGKLQLDQLKLQDKFADDPEGVKRFFTDAEHGFAASINRVIESIAGEDDSLLITRTNTLQRRIESHHDRIAFYNQRLEREEERLLKYYYKLELVISKIQASQSALSALQPLPPLTSSRSYRD
jgi:flagellar hook-associated protein 2